MITITTNISEIMEETSNNADDGYTHIRVTGPHGAQAWVTFRGNYQSPRARRYCELVTGTRDFAGTLDALSEAERGLMPTSATMARFIADLYLSTLTPPTTAT